MLPLSDKHRNQLYHERKLNQGDIKALGVKSYDWRWIHRIINQLQAKYSDSKLLAVPGFFINAKGRISLSISNSGLLIPVSQEGRIAGIRVRPDEIAEGGSKYYWLSSTLHSGSAAKVIAPIYNPISGDKIPNRLGITEGEFKAYIAAKLLGYPFISVPGVGNWESTGTVELAKTLIGSAGMVTNQWC